MIDSFEIFHYLRLKTSKHIDLRIFFIWCGFDRALSIICGNKMPTRCNRWIFIADLIACSTCFGHHYAHHQELKSIIQGVAACRIWCLVFNHLYNTLELLMMGIIVPETCWASNKICNKNSYVASSWHFISTYNFLHLQVETE